MQGYYINYLNQQAAAEYRKKNPDFPELSIPKYFTETYKDISRSVIKLIELNGGSAFLVDNSEKIADGELNPGLSAIAIYKARFYGFLIKPNGGAPNLEQCKVGFEIKKSKNVWVIISDFEVFASWWLLSVCKIKIQDQCKLPKSI